MAVANEINRQIGNRAFTMMGAKHKFGIENGLQFKIGRNSKKINFVKVTLNDSDLYDIEFGTIRNLDYTIKKTENDIYADMMHQTIEQNTGLYLSL